MDLPKLIPPEIAVPLFRLTRRLDAHEARIAILSHPPLDVGPVPFDPTEARLADVERHLAFANQCFDTSARAFVDATAAFRMIDERLRRLEARLGIDD